MFIFHKFKQNDNIYSSLVEGQTESYTNLQREKDLSSLKILVIVSSGYL